jgi:hypothetical protein
MIHDRRYLVVRRYFEKFRLELVVLDQIDRDDVVRKPCVFQRSVRSGGRCG